MSNSSIARMNLVLQDPREGRDFMTGKRALHAYVINLINENAVHGRDGLELFVCDLSSADKRIFLSHIVDAEDYEWLCETASRLEEGINEHKKYMQRLIDENIDGVWHSFMQEAGLTKNRYNDNGEVFYSK